MARPQMGDERREQILEAFERCVIRKGLAKTTLSDVADESGLPRSLVRYFVGNRSDMVNLLIDRIIERAENGIGKLQPASHARTASDMVDLLFDHTFANDVSNKIVGELWHVSERDDAVRKRLADMYAHAIGTMTMQMEVHGIGRSAKERRDAANLIISLVYGQTSFRELGVPGMGGNVARSHAHMIIDSLETPPKKKPSSKEMLS